MATDEPKYIISEDPIIFRPTAKKITPINPKDKYSSISSNNWFDEPPCRTPVIKPFPKKLKKKNKKLETNLEIEFLKKTKEAKSNDAGFDMVSLEEIENDFKAIKSRSEARKVENELMKLMRNSTKATTIDDEEYRTLEKLERPRNPYYYNLEHYEGITNDNSQSKNKKC